MGLEGLVSKRRDRAYRGGRCTHWIKVKNPASLAMNRCGGNRLVAVTERSTIASELSRWRSTHRRQP
jgi:hypothetical protein